MHGVDTPYSLPPPLPPRSVPPLPCGVTPWRVNSGNLASGAAPQANTRGWPAQGSDPTPFLSGRTECPTSSTLRSTVNSDDAEPRDKFSPVNMLAPPPRQRAWRVVHAQSTNAIRPAASDRPAASNHPAVSNCARRFLESFGTQAAFVRPGSLVLKRYDK